MIQYKTGLSSQKPSKFELSIELNSAESDNGERGNREK